MATGKKFYWIKLKDEFMTGDEVDFLMSQKDGSQYVVLYLMLCMICINTDGKLSKHIGEVIIPIDIDKIQRDCKYFNRDTVIIAIELFKKIGLIYEEADGNLAISHYSEMVGHETDYAAQKRKQRNVNLVSVDSVKDNPMDIVHIESRDKSLESRDKSLDIDIESKDNKTKRERFVKPTLEQLEAYKREKGLNVDCQYFLDFYDSKGWMIGKNHMKDWRATMRGWSAREKKNVKNPKNTVVNNFEQRQDDLDALVMSNVMERGKR